MDGEGLDTKDRGGPQAREHAAAAAIVASSASALCFQGVMTGRARVGGIS
jgi:hypothetical protein